MTHSSKHSFQRNKELFSQWSAVANASWFADVLIHARSAMMEERCTAEEMAGANRFVSIIINLCEADPPTPPMPTTGLVHDLDVRNHIKETKKEK